MLYNFNLVIKVVESPCVRILSLNPEILYSFGHLSSQCMYIHCSLLQENVCSFVHQVMGYFSFPELNKCWN